MASRMGGGVSVTSVSNHPVGWLVWRRPPGASILTVVCRATFLLTPGEATLAQEHEPVLATERGYPDGASRGLFAPCDLVPMKPRADVVLVGHAFAPNKQPVRSLFARLSVGEIDKRIEVFVDRRFDLEGGLREGQRWTSMPLVYERAAGGPETANPIGVRASARDTYGRIALPNLQPPGLEIARPEDAIAPIGFGPIAGSWPSRRALLGPSLGAHPPEDWSSRLVPSDLDPAYFNVAPRDQQLQALREDERIALDNLRPDHPELVTRLPGVRARAFLLGQRQGTQPMMMRADTLWIDAGRGICTLTWRAQALIDEETPIRVIVAMQRPGQPISIEDIERVASVTSKVPRGIKDLAHTVETVDAPATKPKAKHMTLPFMAAQGAPPPRDSVREQPAVGLPFHGQGAPSTPPPAPRPDLGAETLDGSIDARSLWIGAQPGAHEGAPHAAPPHAIVAPHPAIAPVITPAIAPAIVAPQPAIAPAIVAPQPAIAPPIVAPHPAIAPSIVAPHPAIAPVTTPAIAPAIAAPIAPAIVAPAPLIALSTSAPPKGAGGAVEAPAPAAAPIVARASEALHLVWFDAEGLAKARRDPRFVPILDAMHDEELDEALDDPDEVAADVEDRREVFEILARGSAIGEEGVAPAIAAATREDGRIVQPVLLVAGELAFPFDELDALKAMIAAASPHAGSDPEAKAVIALAKAFLGTPGIPGAPSVAEGLATRIRETFEKRRLVAAGYLDGLVLRALLGERCFQKRALFGGTHVRAILRGARPDPVTPSAQQKGAQEAWLPVYVGEELGAKLPSAERLRVRMLAEAHPAIDQHEAHPAALRVLALAFASAVR